MPGRKIMPLRIPTGGYIMELNLELQVRYLLLK